MNSQDILRSKVLPVLGLVLACVLVYYPGLSGGFLFDDFPNIVTNPRIHLQELDAASLKSAALAYAPGSYGRPLATLGFAFDHYLGGKDPWGYKLHGLIVHAINALLVLALLGRLQALSLAAGGRAWPVWAVPAIALLWAIHPLQVSTVLYVVQRMELLATTFVLLALLAYLRGRGEQIAGRRGWPWLVGSGLLTGIGMLAKESAVLLPLFTLALELTLLGFGAGHRPTRTFLRVAYASGIAISAVFFIAYVLPPQLSPEAYAYRDFSLAERLLTQLRVLPMYLGQILLPTPGSMTFYYDSFPVSKGWLSPPTTLAGGLLLAALLAAAISLRTRLPLFSLGVFWFFASHAATSNVLALELVFEHRNYFALLGVLLALAGASRLLPLDSASGAARFGMIVVVLGVAGLCALRAATWGHPLLLATELVARNPTSPRASNDLATLYIAYSDGHANSPFYSFGKLEFERGMALPNASPLPEQGLILMAATTGQPIEDAWWDSLLLKVRQRPIGPQERMAVSGLVSQRFEGIEMDDQRLSEAYQALLSRGGSPAHMYMQYAEFALRYLDDPGLATRMYVESLEASGMTPDYATRVIAALESDGKQDIARAMTERARNLGLVPE